MIVPRCTRTGSKRRFDWSAKEAGSRCPDRVVTDPGLHDRVGIVARPCLTVGGGEGSALIHPVLSRCDADHRAAYLE